MIVVAGKSLAISRVIYRLLTPGMTQSFTRTSGLSSIDFCNASEFELASPQISQPGWSWSNTRKMPRVPWWSSAINMRAISPSSSWLADKLVGYFSVDHTYIAVHQFSVSSLPYEAPRCKCDRFPKSLFLYPRQRQPIVISKLFVAASSFLQTRSSCLWP
jgi:hypothetical protein